MSWDNANEVCQKYCKALSIKMSQARQQGNLARVEELQELLTQAKKELFTCQEDENLQQVMIETYPDKTNWILSEGLPWLITCQMCGVIFNDPTEKHYSICAHSATVEIDREAVSYRIMGNPAELKVTELKSLPK